MLAEIRKRLTILYVIVFGIFLAVFVSIFCSGLIWTIYQKEVDEIKIMAVHIAREQQEALLKQYGNDGPREISIQSDYDVSGDVFYLVLDGNGRLIKADLPVPVLRKATRAQFINWDPSRETKVVTVSLPSGDKATLMLAMRKVYRNGNLLGTVYVGRDVTGYARVLFQSIITIMVVTLLFLIFTAILGYFLAGRVIIPIGRSIDRQKQFVADASHELRNPLSVLLTSMEAVQMDKDNVLSPFSRQIIDEAKEEFFRLKNIVNDLLTLARTDTEEVALCKEGFFLQSIADQVIRSLEPKAAAMGVSVRLDASKPLELNADPERIHQLIYILLDNAIKYSYQDSQVLVRIEESYAGGKMPYVKIIVEDTGPGIEPEFQQQIFQRFFRVDVARSRNIEGSGLGLSIARWIVEAHRGEIYVDSELGKGSKFVVKLPRK
ncbi:Hypothetical protein LUCI_4890 [Lucifera butyrica]|uniref:histidine kinase n=1 Tax=Lucifera butyrica TaxID=1351585 RepID=A0A498RF13_9FIRM|nr:HAMP domain-containing sensor histidine kinase [Lucifera butyrica]VBB09595.1 Hypothetical protein LUCI_4890 [Lucifera butyrica]